MYYILFLNRFQDYDLFSRITILYWPSLFNILLVDNGISKPPTEVNGILPIDLNESRSLITD